MTTMQNAPKRGRPCTNHDNRPNRRKHWLAYYYRSDDLAMWARVARQNSRRRAKEQGIEHELTTEEIISLFPDDRTCPILGLELDITKGRLSAKPNSATIDRIDPDGPYSLQNSHVICHLANRSKCHMNVAQMLLMGKWAEQFLRRK